MHLMRTFTLTPLLVAAVVAGACSKSPASPTSPGAAEVSVIPGGPNGGGQTGPIASAPAPRRSQQNFEVDFMTGMIDHHQMAIEMAEICLQKAEHGELRQMCEDIIAAQSAEIRRMQSWLQSWYGISYQPQMKPGDQKMLDRLASLSGAEFEIAFMEMMIKHHEKALKEARQCVDKAYHPELRQLCEDIIAAQTREIAQLEAWLCQWYDRCK